MFLFNAADYPTRIDRQGLPYTRPAQAHILKWLYDPTARPTEQPFKVVNLKDLGLPRQAHTSLTVLQERDWIVASTKAFGELRYQITSRGIKALKLINDSGKKHRADEFCTNCRQRPRKQYPSRLAPYCHECIQESRRKTRNFKGDQLDPNKLCGRCQIRKRAVSPRGSVCAYCAPCRNQMHRERQARRLEQAAQGVTGVCCDCQQALVYITATRVYRRCETCQKRAWGKSWQRYKRGPRRH